MTNLSEGDVVNKSVGGPLMTVEIVRDDEFVAVVWFDGEGHVHRDVFARNTLQKWVRAE